MECSFAWPLCAALSPSVLFAGGSSRRYSSLGLGRLFRLRPPRCQKMFVPGFAEESPEAKAARNLQHFFTYIAVNIVLAQLESYNREGYEELMEFVNRNSLNDGELFCRRLMRESDRHKGLALRILEVRSAYSKRDFEWDNLQKLAFKVIKIKRGHPAKLNYQISSIRKA